MPNFAHVATPLNKKICEGQPQTFDRLTNDEISDLETFKAEEADPPCWFFSVSKTALQYIRTLGIEQWICLSAKPAWRNQQTNTKLVHFLKWDQMGIQHDAPRTFCSSLVCVLVWPYLECFPFTFRTDHDVLKSILNLTDSTVKLARSRLHLFDFGLHVAYRVGIKHREADALPRLKTTRSDQTSIEDVL